MIKEKNTKRIEYYVVLFLISGLFVFNFYITLKNTHLDGRVGHYQDLNIKLQQENKNLTATWSELKKQHLQNIYQTAYTNLQLNYLESKLNAKVNFEFYFSEIQKMTPSTVQIDQISIKGNSIEIIATAGNYSDIGYYTKELTLSGLFSKVDYDFEASDETVGDYVVRNLICHIHLTL